jgi:DNA-directed RNA polymerase subunit RPC12/RpoP
VDDVVCEHCGHQGHDTRPVDEVQCPMCGEPVTPLR